MFETANRLFTLRNVLVGGVLLRVVFFFYGLVQDAYSPMKFTDIDYYVFTDAAKFIRAGRSPYARATYRYTPLLAWMLYPTAWGGIWFSFGKVLFAASDILAGWLMYRILRQKYAMDERTACKYASIWLLNPLVATISTRGSSEGLLGVLVISMLWAMFQNRIILAGLILGFSVHFKIYPFIYAPTLFWWLGNAPNARSIWSKYMTWPRITLAASSYIAFITCNLAMYLMYGYLFVHNTFLYHFIRTDHRHNFSIYNILLYRNSADLTGQSVRIESLAFLPQLFLSTLAIPFVLAKKDLASTMLAQTFAFVTFNKVCTSQYFLWYIVLLPFYLQTSSFMRDYRLGGTALVLWVATQVAWLQQAYQLEFLGRSTFFPGLFIATAAFFLVNCWILGVIISDVGGMGSKSIKSYRKLASKKKR